MDPGTHGLGAGETFSGGGDPLVVLKQADDVLLRQRQTGNEGAAIGSNLHPRPMMTVGVSRVDLHTAEELAKDANSSDRRNQGRVLIFENVTEHKFYSHCEECESGWRDPEEANDPKHAFLTLNEEFESRAPSLEEIRQYGWLGFVKGSTQE